MANSKHPKQGDKTSKIDRMREIVQNTDRNLMAAEIGKEFAHGIQRNKIMEQNERRKQAMEELKEEVNKK